MITTRFLLNAIKAKHEVAARSLALLTSIFLSVNVSAEPRTFAKIPFIVTESQTNYQLTLSTGGSASASPAIEGFFYATVSFDSETLDPTQFTFQEESRIRWENFYLSADTQVRVEGAGTVPLTISTGFNGIGVRIEPTRSEGRVEASTGRLYGSDFTATADQGEASVTLSSNGVSESETVSYWNQPESSDLIESPVFSVERIYDDPFRYDFILRLTFEFDDSETVPVEETNLRITTRESGRVVATSRLSGNTSLGNWYQENRSYFDSDALDTTTREGIPMYLAYALGLRLRIPPDRRPILWKTENGKRIIEVRHAILNEDIKVEYSRSLETSSWKTVPETWLLNGYESLRKGDYKQIVLTLPIDPDTVFIRFGASKP